MNEALSAEDEIKEANIRTMLLMVEIVNADIELYLEDKIENHIIEQPDMTQKQAKNMFEHYLFDMVLTFIHLILKRKQYDVGSAELKFFNVAENLSKLFMHTRCRQYREIVYDLLYEVSRD